MGAGDTQSEGLSADRRIVVSGSAALLSAQILARLAALGLLAVATRRLAPDEYGILAIAASYYAIGTLIADFGTSRVLTRDVARGSQPNDRLRTTAMASLLLGVVAAAGLGTVGAGLYNGDTTVALILVCGGLPAHAVASSIFGVLDGLGRIGLRSVLSLILNLGIFLGGVMALLIEPSAIAAAVPMVVAPWGVLLGSLVIVRRLAIWNLGVEFSTSVSLQFLRASLPFAALSGIAVLYTRIDLVILSAVRSTREVADYDVAVRVVEGVAFPAAIIASIALVVVARRLGTADGAAAQRVVERASALAAITGAVSGGLLAGAAPSLIRVVAGGEFDDVVPLVRVLSLQVPTLYLAALQGAIMSAGHTMRRSVSIGLGLLAAIVVADAVAIPYFGASGAAWTTVVLQVANVSIYARRNRIILGVSTPPPPPGALVAGGAAFAVSSVLEPSLGLASLMPGGAVSVIVLLVTRAVTRSDIDEIRSLIWTR